MYGCIIIPGVYHRMSEHYSLCSVPVKKTFSRLLFHLEVQRLPPSLLAQRRFTASFNSDDDFVKFPVNSIFPGSSLSGVEVRFTTIVLVTVMRISFFQCVDVHYIELVEERLLLEPTLNSKVCAVTQCSTLL